MDGQRLAFTWLEYDSFVYIGIFLLASNWSWMCDCCPFPISKWRNLIQRTLCLGTPLPAHRKIGVIDWKGHWSCPTFHWKTWCACTSRWSTRCVGCCCIAWLGCAVQLRFCWFPFQTRSDQDRADRHLTRPRWSVVTPPWQVHAAQ